MSLRFHEIAETSHRILNPFDEQKLQLLGEICGLTEQMRVLDLACGKGEMLVQWAQSHGMMGVGVDISTVFLEEAKDRAFRMDVGDKLHFVQGDAADYPQEHHQFDVVSCIGATWIGGGLLGTLNLMSTSLKDDKGWLLVGEPYWHEPPTADVLSVMDAEPDTFASLSGTLERFESAGLELVEMIIADLNGWDRYEAQQWLAVRQFLENNPDDKEAEQLQNWIAKNRLTYLLYGRRYMGWGVFVLRKAQKPGSKPDYAQKNLDRPIGIDIADESLWVRLEDGRVIGNPLHWYPWLKQATPEQANDVEFTTHSIIWHNLDQRLEVEAVLRGRHRKQK
jgi:SAM-dependent methyltransferase